MTNRESIIERIKKLRALSTSNNIHEATAATQAAEKLIQQYQLEEAELISQEGEKETPELNQDFITNWGQRQNVWQNILSNELCKSYNCVAVMLHENGKVGIKVIGRRSDIEIVKYNFAYLVLEINRLCDLEQPNNLFRGEAKGWRNSFYRGAVHSIVNALKKEKEQAREHANSNALIVLDKHYEESLALQRKLFPQSRETSMGGNIDMDAYKRGLKAGENLKSKPSLPIGHKQLKR